MPRAPAWDLRCSGDAGLPAGEFPDIASSAGRELNRGVEERHTREQCRAAQLMIDSIGIVMAVGDVFALTVLIGACPNVGRRHPARCVTQAVVFLKKRQRTTSGPIFPGRSMGVTVDERIDRSFLPALEGAATLWHVDRNLVPWIALRKIGLPALRCFTFVNHGNHKPGNFCFGGDILIPDFRACCDEPFGNSIEHRYKALSHFHVLPTFSIGSFELGSIDHLRDPLMDSKEGPRLCRGLRSYAPNSSSTAAAMRNSRRSWPLRDASISPTGSPSPRGSGSEIAQRSKKLTIEALRSAIWLRTSAVSGFWHSAMVGATIAQVGSRMASRSARRASMARTIAARSRISSM